MSDQNSLDDDALLTELQAALAAIDPVPPSVQTAARSAFLTRDLDRELAELIHDSLSDREPVLTRGDTVRNLSFRAGELLIELEAHQHEGLIIGMLVPARSSTIELEIDGLVSASVTTDEFGRFRFETVAPGPTTIVCRSGHNATVPVCTIGFDF